ncbi:MAG: DMT family transporter [Pseudomonadota bacterium]
MSDNIKGVLLSLAAFAIFATHDVFLKLLGGGYAPFQILFFTALFSFPLTIFWLLSDKTEANLRPHHPWWTILRAISGLITAVCAVYAFSVLPLSQTYALLFTMPLFVTLLSVPLLGEKVGWRRAAAVIVGLIGVVIVLQPRGASLGLGHLAALVAAITAAFSSIIIRKIGHEERSIVMMLIPLVGNFVIMGTALPFVYVPMPLIDLGFIALVALLGFCAMALTIAAYNAAEAAIVAPMQYSQIIWATIFGYLIFEETLSLTTALGSAIVIASGLFIVFRERDLSKGNQPVLRSSDQRPTLAVRPRIGDVRRARENTE